MRPVRAILLFAILSLFFSPACAGSSAGAGRRLYVFYSPGCHKCIKAKNEIIPAVEKKFPGKFGIEYFDISEMENYRLMLGLRDKFSPGLKMEVPVFFMDGRMLDGGGLSQQSLEKFIEAGLARPARDTDTAPKADLMGRFRAIRSATVIGLGLIDGINPCAFTVIVFFISFLALQGYARRELAVIGICFISSVFATYVLIGIGAFAFLYRLEQFRLISKAINYGIGFFSICVGGLALYDYFELKASGRTENLKLQLPKPVKDQIHKVVGRFYRVNKNLPEAASTRHIGGLIVSAFVTGFLVSLLEAVCTGQTYLPTIAFILKTTALKFSALAYLLLYNAMFIVPLTAVLIFALMGAGSPQFAGFLKKHLLAIKLLMAVLFFALGIFLFWRA